MREWNAADSHFVHRGLPKYIRCRHGKWTIYRGSTRSVVHLGIIQTQLGACGPGIGWLNVNHSLGRTRLSETALYVCLLNDRRVDIDA